MASRKKNPEEDRAGETSFEASLAGLEALVEEMENDRLPLDELVAHYEKGSALLKHCESHLNAARRRIELITLKNQSEIALESQPTPGHGAETFSEPTDFSDDPDDDDDIRLF